MSDRKLEKVKEIIVENSLYKDAAGKAALLTNVPVLKDIFWINTLGLIALKLEFPKAPKIKRFFTNIKSVKSDVFDDADSDVAQAFKLAAEANLLSQPFIINFGKLLYNLKTDQSFVINQDELRKLFNRLVYSTIHPKDPKMNVHVKEWLDGKLSVEQLVPLFYTVAKFEKHSEEFKDICYFNYKDITAKAAAVKASSQLLASHAFTKKDPNATATTVVGAIGSAVASVSSASVSTPVIATPNAVVTSVPVTVAPPVVAPTPPVVKSDILDTFTKRNIEDIFSNNYTNSAAPLFFLKLFQEKNSTEAVNFFEKIYVVRNFSDSVYYIQSVFRQLFTAILSTSEDDKIRISNTKILPPSLSPEQLNWLSADYKIPNDQRLKMFKEALIFLRKVSITPRYIEPMLKDNSIMYGKMSYITEKEFTDFISSRPIMEIVSYFSSGFGDAQIKTLGTFMQVAYSFINDIPVPMNANNPYYYQYFLRSTNLFPATSFPLLNAKVYSKLIDKIKNKELDVQQIIDLKNTDIISNMKDYFIQYPETRQKFIAALKDFYFTDYPKDTNEILNAFNEVQLALTVDAKLKIFVDAIMKNYNTESIPFILATEDGITTQTLADEVFANVNKNPAFDIKFKNYITNVSTKNVENFKTAMIVFGLFVKMVEEIDYEKVTQYADIYQSSTKWIWDALEKRTRLLIIKNLVVDTIMNKDGGFSKFGYQKPDSELLPKIYKDLIENFDDLFSSYSVDRLITNFCVVYYSRFRELSLSFDKLFFNSRNLRFPDLDRFIDENDYPNQVKELYDAFYTRIALTNKDIFSKFLYTERSDYFVNQMSSEGKKNLIVNICFTNYNVGLNQIKASTNKLVSLINDVNIDVDYVKELINNKVIFDGDGYNQTQAAESMFYILKETTNEKVSSFIRSIFKEIDLFKNLNFKDTIKKLFDYETKINQLSVKDFEDKIINDPELSKKLLSGYRLTTISDSLRGDNLGRLYAKFIESNKSNLWSGYKSFKKIDESFKVSDTIESIIKSDSYTKSEKQRYVEQILESISIDPFKGSDRSRSIVNTIAGKKITKTFDRDNALIPIPKMTEKQFFEILKFNDFEVDLPEEMKYKKKSGSLYDFLDNSINGKNDVHIKVTDPKVVEIIQTPEEKEKVSAEYYSKYSNNSHGDYGLEIIKSFNCNLVHEGFEEFIKANPTPTVIPAFHCTGDIAAAMILRFGFRVVKTDVGGVAVTGKMLGNGIYFTNIISKAQQYLANTGYTRSEGMMGYLLEMEAYLGQKDDKNILEYGYRSAGLGGNDNIRSPEWVVRNVAQLKIVKVHLVKTVRGSYMRDLKTKHGIVNENTNQSSFKEFLAERTYSGKNYNNFVFYDLSVPVGNKSVSYDDWYKTLTAKQKEKVQLGFNHDGLLVTIESTLPAKAVTYHIPDTDDMIENNYDGVYKIWEDLRRKL